MNLEALQDAVEDASRAFEISRATLTIISERRDTEIDSWAIVGVLEQIEKIRDSLSIIDGVLTKEEFCNELFK